MVNKADTQQTRADQYSVFTGIILSETSTSAALLKNLHSPLVSGHDVSLSGHMARIDATGRCQLNSKQQLWRTLPGQTLPGRRSIPGSRTLMT